MLYASWQEIHNYLNAGRQQLQKIHFSQGLNINPSDISYIEKKLKINKGEISLEELGSFSLDELNAKDDHVAIEQGSLFLTNSFLSGWLNKMFGNASNINLKINSLNVKTNNQTIPLKNINFESIYGRGVLGHFEGFDYFQWGENSWVKGTKNSHLFLNLVKNSFCQIQVNNKKEFVFYQKAGYLQLNIVDIKTLFYSSKDLFELKYLMANGNGMGQTSIKDFTVALFDLNKKPKMELLYKTDALEALGTITDIREQWSLQFAKPISWSLLLSKSSPELKDKFDLSKLSKDMSSVSIAQVNWTKGSRLECCDLISGFTFNLSESNESKK